MLMPILAALFAGLAVFAFLLGLILLPQDASARVNARVRQYVSADAPVPTVVVERAQKKRRAELFSLLDERWLRRDRSDRFVKELERADLQMTASEFSLLRLGSAVGVAVLLVLIFPGLWWAVVVPGLLIGRSLPRRYLHWRARRRLRLLDRQLPDLLNILAGSVRTGSSLIQALERLAREADEPSRSEYMRVVRTMTLGAPLERAMQNLSERIPTEDMDMLVTAITIQQQTGGNLGQILDLMATTVRERHRVMREIEVLSAQQRLSAVLLAILPIAMTGLLFLINPTYIGRIFQPGWILVLPCSVVVLLVVGFIVMNKMAAIDV